MFNEIERKQRKAEVWWSHLYQKLIKLYEKRNHFRLNADFVGLGSLNKSNTFFLPTFLLKLMVNGKRENSKMKERPATCCKQRKQGFNNK